MTIEIEWSRSMRLLLMASAIILSILTGLWSGMLLVLEFAFRPLVVQTLWMTGSVFAGLGFLVMAFYLAQTVSGQLRVIANGAFLLLGFHFLSIAITLFVWQ